MELITHLYLETGEEMVNREALVVELEHRLLVLALETPHLYLLHKEIAVEPVVLHQVVMSVEAAVEQLLLDLTLQILQLVELEEQVQQPV